MKQLRLIPLDVAMFRDARPFEADDSSGARLSSLTPPPLTVYGAIRQLLLHESNIRYDEFRQGRAFTVATGKRPAEPGELRLGPVIMANDDSSGRLAAWFPRPFDLVRMRAPTSSRVAYLRPDLMASRTNLPDGLLHLIPVVPESDSSSPSERRFDFAEEDAALAASQIQNYLLGAEELELSSVSGYFNIESRLGIERSSTAFSAKEGRIYTAEVIRPGRNAFFLVTIFNDAGEVPEGPRVLSLGGERRPCSFQIETGPQLISDELRAIVKERLVATARASADRDLRLRVYLLSPAGSLEGWLPRFPPGYKLIAAAVGRPQWLSGWDTATNSPKSARPLIPSGSVFFLETAVDASAEATIDRILKHFWFRPALAGDPNSFEAKAGFGITLVGV